MISVFNKCSIRFQRTEKNSYGILNHLSLLTTYQPFLSSDVKKLQFMNIWFLSKHQNGKFFSHLFGICGLVLLHQLKILCILTNNKNTQSPDPRLGLTIHLLFDTCQSRPNIQFQGEKNRKIKECILIVSTEILFNFTALCCLFDTVLFHIHQIQP